MSIELKIKAKSLVAESKIIRHEIEKLKAVIARNTAKIQKANTEGGIEGDMVTMETKTMHMGWKVLSLANHNKQVVGRESRATHLARAFLAGKAYKTVENRRRPENEYFFTSDVIPKVATMIRRYGHPYKDPTNKPYQASSVDQWYRNEVIDWINA